MAIEQQCFGFRTSLEKLGKNNVDLHEHFTRELSDLSERLAWFEDQPVPHADEEELVPPVSPIGQNSPAHFRFDHQFARDVEPPNVGPFVPDPFGNAPRVGHGFTPPEPQVVVEPEQSLEEKCIRFKEAAGIKFPPLPDSAGALRQWKNTLVPMLNSLDKSAEGRVYTWLMKAFNATDPVDVQHLSMSSDEFPTLDRVLCSWLTKQDSLRGHFGPRIQAYIESALTNQQVLRGRPILNFIVREFDLDSALGGVISAVELFQIPAPENDHASLVNFRDKVQHILTQLPLGERPQDAMLSKWLFERLKRVRPLSITLDRIKESQVGSRERTFEYLWSRLVRHISEQQQEKNLSSHSRGFEKWSQETWNACPKS